MIATIITLVSLMVLIASIRINALADADKILSGKKINHFTNFAIYAGIALFAVFLMHWQACISMHWPANRQFWLLILAYFGLYTGCRWLWFDPWLNWARGLPLSYMTNDKSKAASFVDRFIQYPVLGFHRWGWLMITTFLWIMAMLDFWSQHYEQFANIFGGFWLVGVAVGGFFVWKNWKN